MLRMIEDREFAARTAAAGRELARKLFPAGVMVERLEALYRELSRFRGHNVLT